MLIFIFVSNSINRYSTVAWLIYYNTCYEIRDEASAVDAQALASTCIWGKGGIGYGTLYGQVI